MTTPKIALNKPDYRDARWDIPVNQNWDVLDSLHGTVTEELRTLITSATIEDVFIYDTTKDSDGGAWRLRCQNTSWYNEPLNTETRGATREFPAVALIVVQAATTGLLIYDATKVGCPLWMSFLVGAVSEGGSDYSGRLISGNNTTQAPNAVAALNGIVAISHGNSRGATIINFIKDVSNQAIAQSGWEVYTGLFGQWPFGIARRNEYLKCTMELYYDVLMPGNGVAHDIAMTVLDNAPIDPVTLLPVPTIAVATESGLAVLDGPAGVRSVVTIGRVSGVNGIFSCVHIDPDKIVTYMRSTKDIAVVSPIPSADRFYQTEGDPTYNELTEPSPFLTFSYGTSNIAYLAVSPDGFDCAKIETLAANNGLSRLRTEDVKTNGSVAYITNAYNTGWMKGDIRRAFICDALGTTETFTNLVTNGTFSTDTNWVKQTGWSISGGTANCNGSQTSNQSVYQQNALTPVGGTFAITFTLTARSAGAVRIVNGSTFGTTWYSTPGTYTEVSVNSGNGYVYIQADADFIGSIDNVIATEAVLDRSIKASALAVTGTLTREPVATGAELQAISGFTNSNYLSQPYSADLDFGTGDFYVAGWVKVANTVNSQTIFDRHSASGTRILLYLKSSTGELVIYTREISDVIDLAYSVPIQVNTWCFCFAQRVSGVLEVALNGGTKVAVANTHDLTDDGATVGFGRYARSPSAILQGPLALVRIGAGSLTEAQIADMYRTELPLFQENAKCTLQSTSNDVKALSYDKKYNMLYAGTTDGVTAFHDLLVQDIPQPLTGSILAVSADDGSILVGNTTKAEALIKEVNLREELRLLEHKPPLNIGWEDLRFPATQLRVNPVTLKPDFSDAEVGFLFDAAATETLFVIAQMPHSWKLGSTIYPHVHWMPTTTNTGNVLWRLEYKWVNFDDTTPGSYTAINILAAGGGVALKHQIASFPAISGTGKTLSSILSMKLSRIGGDGTDTYTADALLKEFDIHYEMDTIGSRWELVK